MPTKSLLALVALGLCSCSAPPKRASSAHGSPQSSEPVAKVDLLLTEQGCLEYLDNSYEEVFSEHVYSSQIPGVGKGVSKGDRCEAIEYCRNVIYAGAGYQFTSSKWQQTFASQPWYAPDPDFKKSKLSSAALENLKILRHQRAMCSAPPLEPMRLSGKAVEITADFDGDGVFESTQVTRTSISIGTHKQRVHPHFESSVDDFVAVVDVDASVPGKELMLVLGWPGEPTSTVLFFSYIEDVGFSKSSEAIAHSRTSLVIPGDGTMISADGLCGEFGWRVHSLDERVWVTTSSAFVGAQHDSCFSRPSVYIVEDEGRTKIGEFLSDLRKTDMRQKRDGVSIPPGYESAIRFVLAEQNSEVTYLDEIYLETDDGEKVYPLQCWDALTPKFCHTDGQYTELQQNQELELVFPRGMRKRFVANGYYLDVVREDDE